ncbi:MAG TPA: Hsp20/alpha crystallin family protein [Armatimonadota bacterium]|jgi:HSP20 family protein
MSNLNRAGNSPARITVSPAARLINGPDFGDLRRNMDDLFGRWFGEIPFSPFSVTPSTIQPAVDILETPEAYVLCATLPGINRDDLDLEVTGDTITIQGERKAREEDKNEIYHVRNIGFGTFRIAYTLPAHIDASGVKADYKDGVLEVTLPKVETAKTRSIKVSVG